jgi:sugar lactone lactonase YvrE
MGSACGALALAALLQGCGGGGGGSTASDGSSPSLSLAVGDAGGTGNTDGTGSAARFANPSAIAMDGAGNAYIADAMNHTIRKVTPAGVVTTFAGAAGFNGSDDGPAASARFNTPRGIVRDVAGNLYVADTGNELIRKISPDGTVSTLAGNGAWGSVDGIGTAARFADPVGLAVVGGILYVADWGGNKVRAISLGSAKVLTLGVTFNRPLGLAVGGDGAVYVSDSGSHTIRKVTGDLGNPTVSLLAGTDGTSGESDGNGAGARFAKPAGLAIDGSNNLYVTDMEGMTVRKVTPAGEVSTLAGKAFTFGHADGNGLNVQFNDPAAVAFDATTGNLLVADSANAAIRRIDPGANTTTLAGAVAHAGGTDGQGRAARFTGPSGLAVDPQGNLYVADTYSHTIRKVTPAGEVSTLAGNAGHSGLSDQTGTSALFYNPTSVAVDASGCVLVADKLNHVIRKITPGGVVSTFAGSGLAGSADGTGTAASFKTPTGVALDKAGNLYVADTGNHTIRKITPAGAVSTLAGQVGNTGGINGTGTAARFNEPFGLVVDDSGWVYVAERGNCNIRIISPSGEVTSVLHYVGTTGSADGDADTARFGDIEAIAMDAAGALYVADTSNQTLRKVVRSVVGGTTQWRVTTLAGVPGLIGFMPGSLPGVLATPHGIAVSGRTLYVTTGNGVARIDNLP